MSFLEPEIFLAKTIPEVFLTRVQISARQVALWTKNKENFQKTTWDDLLCQVADLVDRLINAKVQPGKRYLLALPNSVEWIVSDLALQLVGAIVVPVHTSLTSEQLQKQIELVRPSGLLCKDSFLGKISFQNTSCWEQKEDGPNLFLFSDKKKWKWWKEWFSGRKKEVLRKAITQFAQLHEVPDLFPGDKKNVLSPGEREQKIANLRTIHSRFTVEQATIQFTSGTSGEYKGVLLLQKNLVANVLGVLKAYGEKPSDVRLNFLPFSHIYGRVCDYYTWLARGSQLALSTNREELFDDCQKIQPTLLNGVPYLFNKILGLCRQEGSSRTPRELLGGKIRMCCSGGSDLPEATFDFFWENEIPLYPGYGLSEAASVVTVSTKDNVKKGFCGKPIDRVSLKIASDGEVWIQGPTVMPHYWGDRQSASASLKKGWLASGDTGYLDDEGRLKITGRKKEIIVTAGGKKIAPLYLESLLQAQPLIFQAVVLGEGKDFCTTLIVPDPHALRAAIKKMKLIVFSKKHALTHPKVLALFQTAIDRAMEVVSSFEKPKKFYLLDQPFSQENGEVTAKLSFHRKRIEENYAPQIRTMYEKKD
ncbi:MAG: AMP-binding protein [Pirellulaceae bacterium]|nr:AMP-binding protein [Pirellulaceae bacterium]